MSFLTSEWLLPQKEHMVRLVERAILVGRWLGKELREGE